MKTLEKIKRGSLIALMSLSVLSCGTETAVVSGISGTGIVFGTITGFGSIFVNGIEYEIDDASFNVDGNTSASQSNLKIGMVVKLDASNNGDGTGNATSVKYDEAVEGPVTDLTSISAEVKSFQIFGVTILINSLSTVFEGGSSFVGLQNNDVVEVSGFHDQSGQVIATLVEFKEVLQPDSEVELHGQIQNLTSSTFEINAVTVNFDGSTELEDLDNGLIENLYVEVEGRYNSGEINADQIEGEDDDRDEIEQSEGEVSVQGIITDFTDSTHFSINGIAVQVDASEVSASILSQLEIGLEIEVEGDISNGIIIADEVEIRQDERQYKALVSSVSSVNQTITIYYPNISGTIELVVDSESELEDENTGDIVLTDLNMDDEVEIEAKTSGGKLRIKSLKRDDIEKYEISGVVDAFVENVSITINGLIFPLDSAIELEPDNFFSEIEVGVTFVELEDDGKDSDIDEAEID